MADNAFDAVEPAAAEPFRGGQGWELPGCALVAHDVRPG